MPPTLYCHTCGMTSPMGSQYCGRCGRQLTAPYDRRLEDRTMFVGMVVTFCAIAIIGVIAAHAIGLF